MENVINNRDITVQFPDGTTKVVRAHGDVVTLYMAAKAVQKWYRQNSGRSGALLKGFSVVNGRYVARIV
ncbi:hypothetical protein BDZ89DRAFT_1082910 [Hymenopellis radicata]|nr:hypothetical protein BDZ89DRAFT_1082910 [Hymenopellis radicata]